jgi:hypothetical protein
VLLEEGDAGGELLDAPLELLDLVLVVLLDELLHIISFVSMILLVIKESTRSSAWWWASSSRSASASWDAICSVSSWRTSTSISTHLIIRLRKMIKIMRILVEKRGVPLLVEGDLLLELVDLGEEDLGVHLE